MAAIQVDTASASTYRSRDGRRRANLGRLVPASLLLPSLVFLAIFFALPALGLVGYSGFVTHLHMRLPNGDPLLAFLRNGSGLDGLPVGPSMRVIAHWADEALQIVRDAID